MNYKHLSQIERYQIHSLMKAQHNITQIAQLLGRDKSTISRELRRNAGCRGYRAKQACELACKRSELSSIANALAPWVKEQASALLRLQWSPEQIAGKLPVSHESLYLHVYADKAQAAPCGRTCVAKSKRESAAPVVETAWDRFPTAGHRHSGVAQERVCDHGQGFKQDG